MIKFLFAALVLLSSCKTNQKVTSLNDYKNNIISFGSGGGFTGEETIYSLLENGQIFVSKGLVTKTTNLHSTISKKEAKALFEKALKIDFTKESINAPSNKYYTLSFGKYNEAKQLIWGNNVQSPSTQIKELYDELITIITKK